MTTQATQNQIWSKSSLVRQAWCFSAGFVLAGQTYMLAKILPHTDVYRQQDLVTQTAFKVIALLAQKGGLVAFVFSIFWIIKNHCEHPERVFDYRPHHYFIQITAALALPAALLTMTLLGSWIVENVVALS